jgi:membrane protein DedA with SNARE-associated domain
MIARYIELISHMLGTISQGNIVALAALFAVLALGELGVPFPFVLTGVLFFVGYQITQGSVAVIPLLLVLLVLIVGRQCGAALVYWLAHFLGNPFVNWFGKRFRKVQRELDRLKEKPRLPTPFAVAMARLTPGLLVPTSLAAGAIGLRYAYFVLGVTLSAVAWDGTLVASGILMRHGTNYLSSSVASWLLPVGLAGIMGFTWLVGRVLSRLRGR